MTDQEKLELWDTFTNKPISKQIIVTQSSQTKIKSFKVLWEGTTNYNAHKDDTLEQKQTRLLQILL